MIRFESSPLEYIQSLHSASSIYNYDLFSNMMAIQKDVSTKGDEAVIDYTKKFDRITDPNFKLMVTNDEIKAAFKHVSPEFLDAITKAHESILRFHQNQQQKSWTKKSPEGLEYGMQLSPLKRVGLYVPGGLALYPSSVLMNAVPAKIAGVESVVIATPPREDGNVAPEILVAASICGVEEIIKSGGAQSVFAMAYGTESIQKVDKIVGPGNQYVTAAKQMVYGVVDIDKPAGPSEVCVYIDNNNYSHYAAAECLSQLEHDVNSIAIVISESKEILTNVQTEFKAQLELCKRQNIINQSVENSRLILCSGKNESINMVNEVATEHLVLLSDEYETLLPQIKNAGAIFCGPYTPVALGDYCGGPNHVLPTSGTAKFASPLSVYDFQKWSSVLISNRESLENHSQSLSSLTDVEGLDAHQNSISIRLK